VPTTPKGGAGVGGPPLTPRGTGAPALVLPSVVDEVPTPIVGFFDTELKEWCTDGITDVLYEKETGKIEFSTVNFTAHAVVLPQTTNLPLHSWRLHPLGPDVMLLEVVAPLGRVLIEIHAQIVILVGPYARSLRT
jgi:hypothetical protein